MNIKEYISSGIIESYVLGLTNAAESNELELLAAKHPEVRQALDEAQGEMEAFALKEAVAPPSGLKENIWKELQQQDTSIETEASNPVTLSDTAILPISTKKNNWVKYLAAAAIAGLIISIALNISYKKKTEQFAAKLTQIQTKQDSLIAQNHLFQTIAAPNMQKIVLAGVPGHTDDKATVYWNNDTKEVYLDLNNMPTPPPDKQYQLWAIVDGKPVDAGLYKDKDALSKIQKLKVIKSAQMFAITLEPKGGSAAPTLTQMFVAGKI